MGRYEKSLLEQHDYIENVQPYTTTVRIKVVDFFSVKLRYSLYWKIAFHDYRTDTKIELIEEVLVRDLSVKNRIFSPRISHFQLISVISQKATLLL